MSEVKERIIDAAKTLLCQTGYHATSVRDVLEASNTGKGQFYYYFDSKQELGLAVIATHVEDWQTNCFDAILRTEADPKQALAKMLDWIFDYHQKQITYYGCPVGNLIFELSTVEEAFRAPLSAMYDEWESLMAEKFMEIHVMSEDEAKEEARQMIASVQGNILLLKLNQDIAQFKKSMDYLKVNKAEVAL